MTIYFVIGAVLVVWALVLTFGGMARVKDFPDKSGGRVLMALSAGLAVAAFVAVVATTEKEHPREEAAEKAAEEKAAGEQPGEAGERPSATQIVVTEDEYSIKLAGGNRLAPGILTFNVANRGKIQHDLAVQGSGGNDKTPLIDPGKRGQLEIQLVPGPYKFYCSVPGHEQLGMKTTVTVRKP